MDTETLLRDKVLPVDGYVAAGKDEAAKIAAALLGWRTLDSGAIYRTVALVCLRAGIEVGRSDLVVNETRRSLERITVSNGVLELDSEAVMRETIKTPEIDKAVSIVAAIPEVRRLLVGIQRDFVTPDGLVACGRDMCSAIFKEAKVKVFLTAAPEIRARRRFDEYVRQGRNVTYDEVLSDLIERDRHDSTRADSPLVRTPDAHVIDSSHMTPQEVADRIVDLYVDLLAHP